MKQTCDACQGTGLRCYFKGESRFLLTQEECPACCGLGFIETSDNDDAHRARTCLSSPPRIQDATSDK